MIFRRNLPSTRRSKRQWLHTSVQVYTNYGHVDALGINLSDGGMGLFAVATLPVGSQVEVEFHPPRSGEPVRIRGTVRHRALYLYGIEFHRESQPADQHPEAMATLP